MFKKNYDKWFRFSSKGSPNLANMTPDQKRAYIHDQLTEINGIIYFYGSKYLSYQKLQEIQDTLANLHSQHQILQSILKDDTVLEAY